MQLIEASRCDYTNYLLSQIMCHLLQAGVSLEEERDFPARINTRNPGVGEI